MLFVSLSTQWRVGMNGPTGLDYNVLYHKLDRYDPPLTREEYADLESDIRAMEHAALTEMRSKQ